MENILSQSKPLLTQNIKNNIKWIDSISKEINWLNDIMPNIEDKNEDIIDRFTLMSNINRNGDRKTDREEIRRRLAMGSDSEEYFNGERISRKPSLQSRLQSGMNLQICFMNETTSDNESMASDSELSSHSTQNTYFEKKSLERPDTLSKCHINEVSSNNESNMYMKEEKYKLHLLNKSDFLTCQVQLQAEARSALMQAKEMAHMQVEIEKQNCKISPITDMIRRSLEKVGVPFSVDRRRLSRQILTDMNIAQLQIIANDFHTKIESLNEKLVRYLISRDDLHMEQDSMLVDIEDLSRYLDANKYGT